MDDSDRIALQLGRSPRLPATVVLRCADGWPVVVSQAAADEDGHPFPTTYWLTCPRLVHAIGVLEGSGGVKDLEARIEADPVIAADVEQARQRQIALRPELGELGVGGTRVAGAVKCLHAHAAFALGSPPYPTGLEIVERAGGIPARCCMRERAA